MCRQPSPRREPPRLNISRKRLGDRDIARTGKRGEVRHPTCHGDNIMIDTVLSQDNPPATTLCTAALSGDCDGGNLAAAVSTKLRAPACAVTAGLAASRMARTLAPAGHAGDARRASPARHRPQPEPGAAGVQQAVLADVRKGHAP